MGGLAHQILVGLFLKGPHKKKGIVPSFSENFRQEKPRLPQGKNATSLYGHSAPDRIYDLWLHGLVELAWKNPYEKKVKFFSFIRTTNPNRYLINRNTCDQIFFVSTTRKKSILSFTH
jgi:hypothetical protein